MFILSFYCVQTLGQTTEVKWTRFEPHDDEFSVEVPAALKPEGQSGETESRRYRLEKDEAYLFVFSFPSTKPAGALYISGLIRQWGHRLDIYNEEPQRLEFDDPFGYAQIVLVARSKTRLYIAQAVSKTRENEIARHFAATFRLAGEEVAAPPKEEVIQRGLPDFSVPRLDSPAIAGVGQGVGSGRGTGQGNGQGSGISPIAVPDKPRPVFSPVKLLNKPRPGYTDAARFYQIAGTVALRVTLLASGQPGAVTAIRTLPFGLTDQAIDAARRITFEPARRDDTPITVVKQIEYSFMIF
jgi:hypothetical protein